MDLMTKTGSKHRTEYSVYTVERTDNSNDNAPAWEMKHSTPDYRKALARAKILHRSDDYSRVEVKKMVCDERNVCSVVEGYKVFDRRTVETQERRMLVASFCVGALILVGLFLL